MGTTTYLALDVLKNEGDVATVLGDGVRRVTYGTCPSVRTCDFAFQAKEMPAEYRTTTFAGWSEDGAGGWIQCAEHEHVVAGACTNRCVGEDEVWMNGKCETPCGEGYRLLGAPSTARNAGDVSCGSRCDFLTHFWNSAEKRCQAHTECSPPETLETVAPTVTSDRVCEAAAGVAEQAASDHPRVCGRMCEDFAVTDPSTCKSWKLEDGRVVTFGSEGGEARAFWFDGCDYEFRQRADGTYHYEDGAGGSLQYVTTYYPHTPPGAFWLKCKNGTTLCDAALPKHNNDRTAADEIMLVPQ